MSIGDPMADAVGEFFERRRTFTVKWARRFVQRREDAEDAVQDAALRALSTKSPYVGTAKFDTWFCAIVRNCAFEARRKLTGQQKNRRTFVDLPLGHMDLRPSPESHSIRHAALARVASIMDALTPAQRRVFARWFVNGLTIGEISRELGLTKAGVKCHLHRSRAMIIGDMREFR